MEKMTCQLKQERYRDKQDILKRNTNRVGVKASEVRQRVLVVRRVLDLYTQVILVPFVLLREVRSMFEITCLSAHTNSSFQVERRLIIVPVP